MASIKGSYSGEVSFSDLHRAGVIDHAGQRIRRPRARSTPPSRSRSPALPDGSTRVDYDADAMVGGMVGGVGQRVLAGVAKKTAGLFFAAIDEVLTGSRAVTAGAAPAVPGGPPVAEQPSVPAVPFAPPATRPSGRTLLGAAAFGAASSLIGVLVGVLVGARIGRSRINGSGKT